ncbi:hypothetical protein [Clostridium senegalense]|uniref:hypothetical protein n=1 Tax=Clostridium senegalense TaxID=1465809 RepID=UPI000288FA88|nr:hypothetical protein [Clostridium senegalense]
MLKRVGDNMNKTSKLLYYLICIYVLILPIINDKLGIIGKVPDIILMLIIFIYAIYSLKNKIIEKTLFEFK